MNTTLTRIKLVKSGFAEPYVQTVVDGNNKEILIEMTHDCVRIGCHAVDPAVLEYLWETHKEFFTSSKSIVLQAGEKPYDYDTVKR